MSGCSTPWHTRVQGTVGKSPQRVPNAAERPKCPSIAPGADRLAIGFPKPIIGALEGNVDQRQYLAREGRPVLGDA